MAIECEPLCHFGGRLYFTTFPQPAPRPEYLNHITTEAGYAPPLRRSKEPSTSGVSDEDAKYYYFTIDDQLVYLSFFEDWGPLNLAMVYKACILIHELLQDETLASHRLVLYSSTDPRRKANAALLMCLYVMIVQQRPPWEAFHPIAELEFMPFRDAGRGRSDFNLSIQDCLWGLYKAMQNGLCDMNEFDIEDYEYYEKVENGDWNWLTPNFIAFASPVDPYWIKREKEKQQEEEQRKLPTPFLNCLDYFEKQNVKLVVRLNNALYDRQLFLERGINHYDLYFDDGTNPTDEIVRKFIDMADDIIEAGGVVAVHCKAGLGRTGTLIGAYLIWKYGFTATEAIAFMRIVRPGSVVGPQQQYMYLKQLEWCKWSAFDEIKRSQSATIIATTAIVTPATPPAETDEEMEVTNDTVTAIIVESTASEPVPPVTPSRHVARAAAQAGAISPPGQPRKTPAAKRVASDSDLEDSEDVLPALNVAPAVVRRTRAKPASARSAPTRSSTSMEQRPARVTRSAASAAVRKVGAVLGAAKLSKTNANTTATGQAPNKIPRLANGTTARSTAAAAKDTSSAENANTTRRLRQSPSPTPSRLPTLTHKRGYTNTVSTVPASPVKGGVRSAVAAAGAWMTNNAAGVVVPGTKSERPGLRPTRRRRSSFSAADVVA